MTIYSQTMGITHDDKQSNKLQYFQSMIHKYRGCMHKEHFITISMNFNLNHQISNPINPTVEYSIPSFKTEIKS